MSAAVARLPHRWQVTLATVVTAAVAAGCDDGAGPPEGVPDGAGEACDLVDGAAPTPTRDEALAVRDEVRERLADQYEVADAGLARCGDALVVVVTILSGDIADSDKVFTQDGVQVVLVGGREASPL